ncbi:MAG: hypothetical protein AAGA76_06135, partial [Pseudomonadota bacterium]
MLISGAAISVLYLNFALKIQNNTEMSDDLDQADAIVVLTGENGELTGLLTYEELHAVALASQVRPAETSEPEPVRAEIAPPAPVTTPVGQPIHQVMNKIVAQVHSSLEVQAVLDATVSDLRFALGCARVIVYR